MKKQAYSEKLKDPRWQKKRLQILERDDFRCCFCAAEHKTLHVHHMWYSPLKDPWDYPDSSLITLCEECHQEETEKLKEVSSDIVLILKQSGFTADDLISLASYALHKDLLGYVRKEK